MTDAAIMIRRVDAALSRCAYRFSNEVQLHEAIAGVLKVEGVEFERERKLDAKARADFWIDGTLIEVKVDGAFSEAIRQCDRYAVYREVKGIVLATTQAWGREPTHRSTLRDKPFAIVCLQRSWV